MPHLSITRTSLTLPNTRQKIVSQCTTSETVDFSADAKERVRARAKASRKGGIYTIQATRSQKKLMVHAAEQLDIS